MLELKYFKELPCRSLNKNKSYVELAGADLYNDKEGNRYAFISVKNNFNKPFFSLYLYIKEYDSSGTFLKENKFNVPNFYGETGVHIINEPIELEQACDGIEVYIYLAEYIGCNFYNDVYARAGHEKINIELSAMKFVAKTSNNSNKPFTVNVPKEADTTVVEDVKESKIKEKVSYDDEDEETVEESNYTSINWGSTSSVVAKKGLLNFSTIVFAVIAIIAFFIFLLLLDIEIRNFLSK